jgi:membrane protein
LNSEQNLQQVVNWVSEAIPVSQTLITQNLQRVLELRGSIGLLGIVGLAWSASGVFNGLAFNINLAWPKADQRNFLEKRLIAFSMLAVLTLLFLLSVTLQTAINILPTFEVPLLGSVDIYDTVLWSWFSYLTPWFFLLVLYFSLYRWIPNRNVDFSSAFWSAVVAATAWKLATEGFAWYLSSGFGRYELVYGSLGAIVALIFLIYLIGLITLVGAHLSAAIQKWLDAHEN